MELENVELAPLVETVVSAHSLPARAKMMHTDVDLKATACLAEPMLLMSVLDNLYSNAVHYGAESGNICLRSSLHGARVYIDVINTGTPIPQEERAMIFRPFFQGSHQRKGAVKGSGLGLSIARDCIRRMQGELYLVDESGQDVCFRIELHHQNRNNANSLSHQAILFASSAPGSARNPHVRRARSGFSALSMSKLPAIITHWDRR